jgi:dihydropteroate synthase
MLGVIKESTLPTVLMHNLSVPADANITIPENVDVMKHLISWFKKKIMLLESAGIERSQLILDPGVGFGKKPCQSLRILNNVAQLNEFGLPLLVGHSRKGFLKLFKAIDVMEIDFNTAIVSAYLVDKKVAHIRVHNVSLNKKLMVLRKFILDKGDGKSMGVLEYVAQCLKDL